jgi:diadenosine tetraphosphatase ApaH/serine/threonine PP2A family protein phosphatase
MRPPSEKKLAQNQALSDEDVAWLRGLPTVIVTELWVLVHGGLMPGVALAAQKVDHMLRVRWVDGDNKYVALDPEDPRQPEGTKTWMEVYDGDRNVVYGHAAHSLSTVRKDGPNARGAGCFGIDTGCVYGGRLTAFVLETQEVIQVQARKVYAEPPFPIPA